MTEELALSAQVKALEERMAALARTAALDDVRRTVESVERRVRELPDKIAAVRARGYPYRSFLENTAQVFEAEWQEAAERVAAQAEGEVQALNALLATAQARLTALRELAAQLEPPPGAALGAKAQAPSSGQAEAPIKTFGGTVTPAPGKSLSQAAGRPAKTLKPATSEGGEAEDPAATAAALIGATSELLGQVEGRARDTVAAARGAFTTLTRNIDQTGKLLDEVNWTLDQVEEATFDFQPGEHAVIAAPAQWYVQGGDNPEGVLYLTDRRLVFEQKQKKGGFLGFGGQRVQDIAWEVPARAVEQARAYKEGLFGRKDMIDLALGAGAPFGQIVVEVKKGADNAWWLRQIERVRTGAIAHERVGGAAAGVDEVAVDAPPANCPNCGALLPAAEPGAAPQREITCPYCDSRIRL